MVQRAHVAFPDYHEELEEMIAEGDKVVVRFVRLHMLCDSPEAFVKGGSGSVAV